MWNFPLSPSFVSEGAESRDESIKTKDKRCKHQKERCKYQDQRQPHSRPLSPDLRLGHSEGEGAKKTGGKSRISFSEP